MANLQVDDLPLVPAVDGGDVYIAKSNLDYRVRTGEAGGLATLDGTGKVPAGQLPTLNFLPLSGGTLTGPVNFYNGTVGTQIIGSRFGWGNNIQRWATVLETTAAFSLWSYDSAGATPTQRMTIANTTGVTTFFADVNVNGITTSSGDVRAGQNFAATGAAAVLATTGAGNVILRPNGSGSGTGQFSVGPTGAVSAASSISFVDNIISTTANFVIGPTGAGNIFFRPNGVGSTTGQAFIDSAGQLITSNTVLSGSSNFIGAGVLAIVAPQNAGNVLIRPNTAGSNTGELVINNSGLVTANGQIRTQGGSASFLFVDRSTSRQWQMYATGDFIRFYNNSSDVAVIDSVGNVTATNFTATSDERLKKDITPKAARRELADKLRLVNFVWKESGDKDQGLIAQDVQAVAPEYVKDVDGKLAVDKIGLLLECVVDLAQRVHELEEMLE